MVHCAAQAVRKNGFAVVLDVVGAIPAVGNAVSATAAGARLVDGAIGIGGGVVGVVNSFSDEAPYGSTSAGAGLGLALAGAAFEGSKVIPVAGNILSGLTGLYDIYSGYKVYQRCMAPGGKQD